MERRTPADTQSNAYELFILVLTVYSLLIMVALVLPDISASTRQLLGVYDNGICLVFLGDFTLRLVRAPSKRDLLLPAERGWLDLLGSIPSFGFFRFSALFRLARLSRLARITRLFRGQRKNDRARHREQPGTVRRLRDVPDRVPRAVDLVGARAPAREQLTGRQHHHRWRLAVVVGGHPHHRRVRRLLPVTGGGRIVASVVMLVGVGIIASLASILARIMVPTDDDADLPRSRTPSRAAARGSSRREVALLRQEPGQPADRPGGRVTGRP